MIDLKQTTQHDLSADPTIGMAIPFQELMAKEFPKLVKVERGEFVLDNGHYRIEVKRVKNYAQLVRWVHHLMGKRWATKEVLEPFIEVVCEYHGLQLHRME